MSQMSQGQTIRGVGRLHCGHRNLGCVGYLVQSVRGQATVVRLDPMPDPAYGDIFNLTLEDGRILECQLMDPQTTYCAVLDGPRIERRYYRRPAPRTRAYL
jgi:hypothetical protein